MDGLEADVIYTASILKAERYYEHIEPLFMLIEQCKHYQRLAESLLNSAHGARTFEENEQETHRAQATNDWYRHKDD